MRIRPRWKDVDHAEARSPGVPRRCRGSGPYGSGSVEPDREGLRNFEGCLPGWIKKADVEDGNRPGVTEQQSAEVRDLKNATGCWSRRTEVLRRAAAYLSQANLPGK